MKNHSNKHPFASPRDRALMAALYALLAVIVALVLAPTLNIIVSSFSSPRELSLGKVYLWPVKPTLIGYRAVLNSPAIGRGFGNSLFYAVAFTALSVALTALAAYPLSRKDLPGRRGILFAFTLTMFIGGGMIANYLLMSRLNILNTPFVMILPGALGAWNVIICRTFFNLNVPDDLLQAAQIDGCDDFRFLARMVLPLAKPVLAVTALNCIVGSWNSYFNAMMYLKTPKYYPLQLILRNLLLVTDSLSADMDVKQMLEDTLSDEAKYLNFVVKYALIVISSAPLLMIYPFVQKYFIKGMLVGSLKM